MTLRTKRVYLGTAVTPLPSRLPWKLAREVIMLDHLSHGRLILGDATRNQLGAGFLP
jgi:alkanesulfonate monooxygenase SsuD/methylene tetrahydromethanopterin reductase-like flavin-dependent oxidoreductase (luciferase family)